MLNPHLIARNVRHQRFDALLQAVADNGLELPLPLRARLLAHVPAVIALALRRLVDLTYGPTALSRQLTTGLLEAIDADGSVDGDPLATAVVAAALARLGRQQMTLAQPEVGVAVDRLLAALAGMQRDDGLFDGRDDHSVDDRTRTAAFILYLLADEPSFAHAVRYGELLEFFEQHAGRLEPATGRLWLMARVAAHSHA